MALNERVKYPSAYRNREPQNIGTHIREPQSKNISGTIWLGVCLPLGKCRNNFVLQLPVFELAAKFESTLN